MPIINITSTSQFYKIINSPAKVLCLYYWKSCGYCREFAPVWNRVTNAYKDKLIIVNIEASIVNKLNSDDKVMLFPTVIVFQNGRKISAFNKQRNEENLVKFINTNFVEKPNKPKRKPAARKQT